MPARDVFNGGPIGTTVSSNPARSIERSCSGTVRRPQPRGQQGVFFG
jgi:hypothetical protein